MFQYERERDKKSEKSEICKDIEAERDKERKGYRPRDTESDDSDKSVRLSRSLIPRIVSGFENIL